MFSAQNTRGRGPEMSLNAPFLCRRLANKVRDISRGSSSTSLAGSTHHRPPTAALASVVVQPLDNFKVAIPGSIGQRITRTAFPPMIVEPLHHLQMPVCRRMVCAGNQAVTHGQSCFVKFDAQLTFSKTFVRLTSSGESPTATGQPVGTAEPFLYKA